MQYMINVRDDCSYYFTDQVSDELVYVWVWSTTYVFPQAGSKVTQIIDVSK